MTTDIKTVAYRYSLPTQHSHHLRAVHIHKVNTHAPSAAKEYNNNHQNTRSRSLGTSSPAD
jgi:hypothetical protein